MPQIVNVGFESLRSQLVQLAANNTVINEVYIVQTQQTGEPDLMGVTVQSVQGNFVVFSQSGSPGMGRVTVRIDSIVAIDA